MIAIVVAQYETAAASVGEVRLYIDAAQPLMMQGVKSALGYGYGAGRDRLNPDDPWEYAFGDARGLASEAAFEIERDRVRNILLSHISGDWEAEFMYYPPRRGSALYFWSSIEDTGRRA